MARHFIEIPKGTAKTSPVLASRADFLNVGNTLHFTPFYSTDTVDTWPPNRPDGAPYQGFVIPTGGKFSVASGEQVTIIARNFDVKVEIHEVGV